MRGFGCSYSSSSLAKILRSDYYLSWMVGFSLMKMFFINNGKSNILYPFNTTPHLFIPRPNHQKVTLFGMIVMVGEKILV